MSFNHPFFLEEWPLSWNCGLHQFFNILSTITILKNVVHFYREKHEICQNLHELFVFSPEPMKLSLKILLHKANTFANKTMVALLGGYCRQNNKKRSDIGYNFSEVVIPFKHKFMQIVNVWNGNDDLECILGVLQLSHFQKCCLGSLILQ